MTFNGGSSSQDIRSPMPTASPLLGFSRMEEGSDYSSCEASSSRQQQSPRREHKAPCCGSAMILLPMVLISMWQALVVQKYSMLWPDAMWNWSSIYSGQACRKIFFVIHWTLALNLIITTLEAIALVVTVVPQLHACFWPCVYLSSAMECCAGLVRCALAMWGMFVVAGTDSESCEMCRDLYSCAWWCFIGMFGLSLVVGSCLYFLAWRLTRSGAESSRSGGTGMASPRSSLKPRLKLCEMMRFTEWRTRRPEVAP